MSKFVWGQTAFDKMDHKDLLLMAKKMYQPLLSMKCSLRMMEPMLSGIDREETLPIAEEVLGAIHSVTSEENMFRQYYRYACDLLYYNHPKNWHSCPKKDCGFLLGGRGETPKCFHHKMKMKPITWKLFK